MTSNTPHKASGSPVQPSDDKGGTSAPIGDGRPQNESSVGGYTYEQIKSPMNKELDYKNTRRQNENLPR